VCDKHRVTEEPCDAKVSSTVLESSGSREGVADFNCKCGKEHFGGRTDRDSLWSDHKTKTLACVEAGAMKQEVRVAMP
jgi:hypothetical protein